VDVVRLAEIDLGQALLFEDQPAVANPRAWNPGVPVTT
jgi:hypothetical protein